MSIFEPPTVPLCLERKCNNPCCLWQLSGSDSKHASFGVAQSKLFLQGLAHPIIWFSPQNKSVSLEIPCNCRFHFVSMVLKIYTLLHSQWQTMLEDHVKKLRLHCFSRSVRHGKSLSFWRHHAHGLGVRAFAQFSCPSWSPAMKQIFLGSRKKKYSDAKNHPKTKPLFFKGKLKEAAKQ